MQQETELETKFVQVGQGLTVEEGNVIAGYASLFGASDQGGDVVQRGAYAKSLKALLDSGRQVKMLWQHDPRMPIGIWDEVCEDSKGLWVKGRLLESVAKGREAAALIAAGAIDGLSIGYRTQKATTGSKGHRLLQELELWEVSLVTFPMLPSARLTTKDEGTTCALRAMVAAFEEASRVIAVR
ncbi:HK97 family phage prohead protease [Shimia sp. MMG029]|uniref:HK97 family phage prohead protease n=1 Tax=Shimia sp. MMG029 TaxID=3021978 RepID=UPI0022FF1318|nr:HK97 family phage prohead protease [Shimia sp. MMG029]MDA5555621.1 HK97 family phage prohead protease [Shimia sp. MMG029]